MDIKNIEYYCEKLKEKYPTISKSDIEKILKYGWKALYLTNLYGADVVITNKNFWSYIGTLTFDSIKHYKYYIRKLAIRFRMVYKRDGIQWDGFYYFALNTREYEYFTSQQNKKGRKRKIYNFKNIKLYKIKDECSLMNFDKQYIFKTTYPINIGYVVFKPNYNTSNFELIETRSPLKFKDILINNTNYEFLNYGKRSGKYI